MAARGRAMLAEGDDAEPLYREAIDRLERTHLRPELARSRLLYGEWLRRANRRLDARAELRIAHESFATIGMEAFAERARGELHATGEHVRAYAVETRDELTKGRSGRSPSLPVTGSPSPRLTGSPSPRLPPVLPQPRTVE